MTSWWRGLSPLPTLAAVLVIAITCALGNWQLDRAHQKTARAERLHRLAAMPPLDLATVPPAMRGEELVDRPVRAHGRFDSRHVVLLENRPHGDGRDTRSGFLVLTPLWLDGQRDAGDASGQRSAVLVLRGWLPRDPVDRTRIAPFTTPDDIVSVNGVALGSVPRVYSLGDAADEAGQTIRQNLDLQRYAAETGLPLLPIVLRQHGGLADGLARDWPAADLGTQRHYGYAFQWFGLATLTLVLLLGLSWRRARRMRAPQRSA